MLTFDPEIALAHLSVCEAELLHLLAMVSYGSGVDLVVSDRFDQTAWRAGRLEGRFWCRIRTWGDAPADHYPVYRWLDKCLSREWTVECEPAWITAYWVASHAVGRPLPALRDVPPVKRHPHDPG